VTRNLKIGPVKAVSHRIEPALVADTSVWFPLRKRQRRLVNATQSGITHDGASEEALKAKVQAGSKFKVRRASLHLL
jgi:hypothetical protein